MKNEVFMKSLVEAGKFVPEISDTTDSNIKNFIRNYEPEKSISFAFVYRLAFSFLILAVIIGISFNVRNYINNKKNNMLYQNVISRIIEVNNTRDLKAALDLYSNEFFLTHDKNAIKNNISRFFSEYKEIKYKPEKEKVVVKNNRMMIENKFTYIAKNKKDILMYNGKERIYLKKENNNWKIIAWIYEK